MKRIKFNLKDIYSYNISENYYMVIYAIKNLIDKRIYIGKCQDLIDRFVDNPMWSHYEGNLYIDNSIRFNGAENFDVIILKFNLTESELNYYEELYINKLHTYYKDPYWLTHKGLKQYNQVKGGHGYEYYKSLAEKSIEARLVYGNGDSAYMMHTKEAIENSIKARIEKYGHSNGNCSTPEARKKADKTNRDNHSGRLAWNYEGQTDDMMKTQKENHGGVLAFHTPEARELANKTLSDPKVQEKIKLTNKNNHGGVLAWHTEDARLSARETNLKNGNGIDPCYFFRGEEVRCKATNARWLNAFNDTCNYLLRLGYSEFNLTIYYKYKHSHAPVDVVKFISDNFNDLDILNKFDKIDLT